MDIAEDEFPFGDEDGADGGVVDAAFQDGGMDVNDLIDDDDDAEEEPTPEVKSEAGVFGHGLLTAKAEYDPNSGMPVGRAPKNISAALSSGSGTRVYQPKQCKMCRKFDNVIQLEFTKY